MRYYIKRGLCIFIIFTLPFIITGCWNNRDLSQLAIVVGVGFDKTADGEIEYTVQIANPSAFGSGENKSGGIEQPVIIVTTTGRTVLDAVRNMLTKLNRRGFYGQLQLVVIGEKVAKSGIGDVLDFFERGHEINKIAKIIIAKNATAKKILELKSKMEKIPVSHIVEALESSSSAALMEDINLIEVIKHLNNPNLGTVISTFDYNNNIQKMNIENMKIEGSAVFHSDKLAGYFNGIETKGFLFVENLLQDTVIIIPNPLENKKFLAIELLRSNGKKKVKFNNGSPIFIVEVMAEGYLNEEQGTDDLTKPDMIKMVESEIEKEIIREIKSAFNLAQQEYKTDAFGFLDEVYKNYYKEWSRLHENWDEVFRGTPVEIKVQFTIRRSGLITSPSVPK